MKSKSIKTLLFALLVVLTGSEARAQQQKYVDELTYVVCPHYKTRADGEPGREILISYNGEKTLKNARLEILTETRNEIIPLNTPVLDSFPILLPPSVGVSEDTQIRVNLIQGKERISRVIPIPAARHWTVYIYPHSHVDIGYTNTQENVEIIHKRNLENAIRLAQETADYPEGARFLWNPEVTWPLERYFKTATPAEKEEMLDAIRKGYIHVDAGYVSTNTSAAGDEELFELLRYSKKLEKLTGRKVETMVQVDIPGVSWGVVPTLAQLDIPYCLALFNGYDRTGLSHELSFRPFWWESPDKQSKVLFLQPGSYNPGAIIKGKHFWPLMAGQTDPSKLLQIVKTDNPRENFIDWYLFSKTAELEKADYYPYDIFPMTWCMADNTPIDADLPEAVKSWNEEYAYPRLVICSATEMMKAFDEKYGDQIPTLSGDFTEYWTDGLGTAAKHTGMNRVVKERLIQSETLWSMLRPNEAFPRDSMEEAWRNVILGTEHTWAFMEPARQPISDDILKVKLGFFETAERMSYTLLESALPETEESSTFAVFNTHSWEHGGVVKIPASQSAGFHSVTDAAGKEALSQRLSTGELAFLAEAVPAFGSKKYTLQARKGKTGGSFIKGNSIDNGLVRVTLDPQSGDVVSLVYDSEEFVNPEDMSAVNSYRYLRGGDPSGKALKATNNRITVKENGPLIATLRVESDAEGCNGLIREVTLTAGQPYVEFNNEVDKIAITDKEGIHFGFAFDIPNPVTQVDIPWGVMELEKEQIKAGNRNWISFQRWLNISNDQKAVTWCALDACAFESGDMTANVLGGAFGSPKWIRRLQPSATVYSWALNNHWHTNFQLSQEGKIQFRYRALPQASKYDAAVSNRFGMEQIQPLQVAAVGKDFEYTPNISLTSDPSVVTSMVKTIDDGRATIIRLRSVSDSDQEARIEWKNRKPKSMVLCGFGEEREGGKAISGSVKIPARGFVTVRADW